MKKPLIFMDPFPRNQSMVFTSDCAAALGQMGDIVAHWGSRAPDELVEQHLKAVWILRLQALERFLSRRVVTIRS